MPRVSPAVKSKARLVRDETPTVPRLAYSRAEAAGALGCAVETIDAWISTGTLRASRPPGGRRVFILVSDVMALLTASEITAA